MRILLSLLLLSLLSAASALADETANDDPVKSWTRDGAPRHAVEGSEFLKRLAWKERKLGPYTLRLGYIYDRWVAAMQFARADGSIATTEITPPGEFITLVDAATGERTGTARDVNHDKVPEIAFLHQKLHDPNYHMYTVYALELPKPKLLWKSGGKLGDWLHEAR